MESNTFYLYEDGYILLGIYHDPVELYYDLKNRKLEDRKYKIKRRYSITISKYGYEFNCRIWKDKASIKYKVYYNGYIKEDI